MIPYHSGVNLLSIIYLCFIDSQYICNYEKQTVIINFVLRPNRIGFYGVR